MKVKKFKSKQILKLHLLNSKTYEHVVENFNSGFITSFNLTKTINDFKTFLNIIFEYHRANKKVLFIGLPQMLELRINRLSNHVAVNSSFELQNLTSSALLQSSKSVNAKNLLFSKFLLSKLSQKPDLIVLLTHEKKQNYVVEKNLVKVPLIVFSSNNDFKNYSQNICYHLTGFNENLTLTSEKNLLFLGLNFLFKQF
jgi:ribosomal protein S2